MSIDFSHAILKLKFDSMVGTPVSGALEVITDTRKVVSKSLFVAIKGEKFDAFNFIEEALKKGAVAVLYNYSQARVVEIEKLSALHKSVMFVGVNDTISYLQKLANYKLAHWYNYSKHVIGITGSNGKTTTKEMIYGLFKAMPEVKVQATIGNFNNHIGLPLTILSLNDETTISLVEMGMNHRHEIEALCKIAQPTSGVITNIGTAHIEHLGSREEIFKEKSSLFHSVINSKEAGVFIVNDFDEYCAKLPVSNKSIRASNNSTLSIVSFDDESLTIKYRDTVKELRNTKLYGRHLFQNLGLSILLVATLYPANIEQILVNAQRLELPSNNRSEWLEKKSHLVFLDAYNANPQSMKISLEVFKSRMVKLGYDLKEVLIIIGDMNELGVHAEKAHEEIGERVLSLDFQQIAFVGKYRNYFLSKCPAALSFATKTDLEIWLKANRQKFKCVFIKGSRSLQLESLVDIV